MAVDDRILKQKIAFVPGLLRPPLGLKGKTIGHGHAFERSDFMTVRILTSGDQALTVEFSDQIDETVNQRVAALAQSLAANPVAGIAEAVPTYRSRLVTYNSEQLRGAALSSLPVNTDRAGIAEEPAPVAAIAAGQVRAARLHVYSHDAPPGPLGATGQVIFTPHLGSATDEARRRVAAGAIGHVLPVLAGKRPATALN